ncbi:MAG TPA: Gfo/Idh/MocA family oxidoreductase [bacterium]|nr:Gfo/Idh/MocA family oxidoreductase [bacterium]
MMSSTSHRMSRRAFLSLAGLAAGSLYATPPTQWFAQAHSLGRITSPSGGKVRVALVGTGSRGTATWGSRLIHPYADYVEMVGLCDINPKRVEIGKQMIGTNAPTYHASEFDRMIEETSPDLVITTTPDCFHAEYALRAMELGCDVLSEKPLATEADQCQQLLDTEARTGQTIWVGFNARHGRSDMEIKRILNRGDLGRLISAEFEEYLDVDHGASYFRRWHGQKKFSGSLLVHKASHHFDQINWWMDAEPVRVQANGKVAFYGHNNAFRGEKCRGCSFQDQCDFYWDITRSERYMQLYVQCEDEDHYYRDNCLWDNNIDTYDTMTVEVEYTNGVILSYSLNTFMPYEGQRIAFNGENGRLDVRNYQRQSWEVDYEAEFRLSRNFGTSDVWQVGGAQEVDTGAGQSGHGGADGHLKDLLFLPDQDDPLTQIAGSRAGVMSSLTGIAARQSIETGEPVEIADLLDIPNSWNWWGSRG